MTELQVDEDPAARTLTFSLLESAFMKEFVGSWDVCAGASGLTEVRACVASVGQRCWERWAGGWGRSRGEGGGQCCDTAVLLLHPSSPCNAQVCVGSGGTHIVWLARRRYPALSCPAHPPPSPALPVSQVRHRLSVRPSLAPPQRVGDITKKVFRKQVEGILNDLAEELESVPAWQR